MKKINLKTNEFKTKSSFGGATSLIIGSAFLAVTVIALGWLYLEKQKVIEETEDVKIQISQKQNTFDKASFKELYNFEKRLLDLGSQLQISTNPVLSLTKLATTTFPETYFSNLEIESNIGYDAYSGQIMVPDFPALARQINAYTSLEELDEFMLLDSGYVEEGVQASISFNIKESSIDANKEEVTE